MGVFSSLRSKKSNEGRRASLISTSATDFGPTHNATPGKGSNGNSNGLASGLPAHPLSNSGGGGDKLGTTPSRPTTGTGVSTQHQQADRLSLAGADSNSLNGADKPRPSDLFAGKGVQWDSVRLAGPAARVAPPNGAAQGTQEDLQSFLKARRQWVPTFVTEETTPEQAPPSDLRNLTFASPDANLSSGSGKLMSLADLDASHRRKQALLSTNAPIIGTSLFDEPGTSAQGAAAGARAQKQAEEAAARAAAPASSPKGVAKQPSLKKGKGSWRKLSSSSARGLGATPAAQPPGSAAAATAATASAAKSPTSATPAGATGAGAAANNAVNSGDAGGGGGAGGAGGGIETHDAAVQRATQAQHAATTAGVTNSTTIVTTTLPPAAAAGAGAMEGSQPVQRLRTPTRKPVPGLVERTSSMPGGVAAAAAAAAATPADAAAPSSTLAPGTEATGAQSVRASTDGGATAFGTPELQSEETFAPASAEPVVAEQQQQQQEAVPASVSPTSVPAPLGNVAAKIKAAEAANAPAAAA